MIQLIIFIYVILAAMLFNAYRANQETAVFSVDLIKGIYFGADVDSIEVGDDTISYAQVMLLCFTFTVKYVENE